MTIVPQLNGRSAAAQFLEEHDQINRDLMLAQDEATHLKEMLNESAVRNDLLAQENQRLREQIAQERARGDKFQRYTVALSTHLTAVEEAFKRARQMAMEAAQDEAQKHVGELTPEENTQLAGLTARLAPNQLS